MSRPKLYGTSGSRALRSIWMMEELGIDYEHIPTHFNEESKQPAYLKINPNGRVPALVDGDIVLFESMAINLYLAKTYGKDLYPTDPAAEAKVWQWSVWAISEIEPLQMQIVIQNLFVPKEKRNQKVIDHATNGLVRPFKVLNDVLAGQDYLLGDRFTVADLNLSSVMLLILLMKYDFKEFPNIQAWLQR
ncbi:glutathione S-transferase family protein, partial [bacterium]|nr:glutathione S-transferase family protein [bacterium]